MLKNTTPFSATFLVRPCSAITDTFTLRVLTAGSMKVRQDPRLQLMGTDLVLQSVELEDGGKYDCEVSKYASIMSLGAFSEHYFLVIVQNDSADAEIQPIY